MNRIVRLETEYGCLTSGNVGATDLVGFILNWIFDNHSQLERIRHKHDRV